MRNIVLFLVWAGCLMSLASCKDKAKEYKDILEEGSWYVYDIQTDYKFYSNWATPALKNYIRYLLNEKSLLFLPGDEISFANKHVNARTPLGFSYDYGYYYSGKYICIGDHRVSYGLNPDGDNDRMTLDFDKNALQMLLNDLEEDDLLEDMGNLKKFHIVYFLQRPVPLVAQAMSGVYTGKLYDGTGQLLNEEAILNLFWRNNVLNLSLDQQIVLEGGPGFYLEMPGIQTKEGFTPESYEFFGTQTVNASSGEMQIQAYGRYKAGKIISMEVNIQYGELIYQLQYLEGIRQWWQEEPVGKSIDKNIVLKGNSK